jgi:hypothetical protein
MSVMPSLHVTADYSDDRVWSFGRLSRKNGLKYPCKGEPEMPSATLLYTAQLLHPSDPSRRILELDTSVEIEWDDEYEGWFTTHDIFLCEDRWREGVHYRKHFPLPEYLQLWVRTCIANDRQKIAKAITEAEDNVVTFTGTDGGRLSLAQPF